MDANNVPLNLVDNSEFCALIEELDSQYSLSHRYKMGKIYQNTKSKVSGSLGHATKVSICEDI